MNKTLLIALGIIALGLLQQCKSRNNRITDADLGELKQKYSDRAINYFYETAFSQDYVGPKEVSTKWENDIWISLQGELWANDSLYVAKAMEQLNALNLPIRLRLTDDTILANLPVYFGDYSYLEEKLNLKKYVPFLGIGFINEGSSEIRSAKIGIANNASSYVRLDSSDSAILRQKYILEEITQSLGITADSWEYHNSVFFEGKNRTSKLSELDKQVVKLLYEPGIPNRYSRKQFEKDFQDILYHKNTKEKLIRYVKENNVPLRYLEYIRDNGFNDGLLFKFPRRVFVKIKGHCQQQDIEFCKKAVNELNTVSDLLQFEMSPDDVWHQAPCITIEYKDSTLLASPIAERFLEPGGIRFTRRVRGTIRLSYNKSGLPMQKEKNKLLLISLYKLLGLDHARDEIAEIDDDGELVFKPDYKEILSFLYSPIFPAEFSSKEMESVINALQREKSF